MTSNREILPPSGDLVEHEDQIVAAVDKDAFRAMFYMFAGKPDSKHQTYKGRVSVSPSALVDLNTRVQDKFKLHSVEETITTVSLSLDNNQALDFGTWAEFASHDWRDPAAVRELTIKWDFMLRIASFAQAQRHTLAVSFSGGAQPSAMLRIMLDATETPQEIDLSKMFGGCIAKVDFISHALAEELLALVGRWHATLPKSDSTGSFFERCERNDSRIAFWIHRSLPVAALVVAYFALGKVVQHIGAATPLTVDAMRYFCLWLLGTVFFVWVADGLGKAIANKAYRAITSFGTHHTFEFTSGDAELRRKLEQRNKKSATRFCLHLGYAVSVHVLAGLIVVFLLGGH